MSIAADTAKGAPVLVSPDSVVPLERRRYERLGIYLKVRWEGALGRHDGTVSDISPGGCFVLSEGETALRELVRLEIEVHTGQWVKVWGEVMNLFPGVGFGVRYTEVDEEDEGSYVLTLAQTKSIKTGVGALKRVDRSFAPGEEGAHAAPRVDRQEYKARLVLALPTVNKTLLELPECQKKTAFRLSVQAYADLYRVWSAMAEAAAGHPGGLSEACQCLKERYEAPPAVFEAVRRGDAPPVLSFLRRKARIYLTFVS
jgi:hypothetical protein